MSISVSARKAKARRLQQFVRDTFRTLFKGVLEDGDISSIGMGQHGSDIQLSPLAMKYIPWEIECKNTESFNFNSSMQQAIANTPQGRMPLVVCTKNRDEVYVSLKFDDFIKAVYE